MEISQITQYIIELSPAITALIGVVVALVVGIKKIKKANEETVRDVKATNKEIKEANIALLKENVELKGEIKTLMRHIKNIKTTEDETK